MRPFIQNGSELADVGAGIVVGEPVGMDGNENWDEHVDGKVVDDNNVPETYNEDRIVFELSAYTPINPEYSLYVINCFYPFDIASK